MVCNQLLIEKGKSIENDIEKADLAMEERDELFSASYRFSSDSYDEQYKIQRRYIREVKIYQVHFPREYNTYRLYCKRYVFDDPYCTALIRKVAYVFDVLTLKVSLDNQLLSIDNMDEIKVKWDKTKEDLQRNHRGDEFDRYMSSIDDMLNNPDKLIAFTSSDKMYGLFLKSLVIQQNVDESAYRSVRVVRNRKVLTNIGEDNRLLEQVVIENGKVIEFFQVIGNTQYELLWIG